MLSPFQKQSRLRKLIYGGLILALFTATLLHREYVLRSWAQKLDLSEQQLGEAELTGSVVNLTLTGSRGFALVLLWDTAIKMQQRHQWSEFDLTVTAITKLQPHYAGPWQYHSWNLAYNVPADCVRVEDKYFWIARGMQLLADGQAKNRDNPDLRSSLGFFYQHKFGPASDEGRTLRTLLQLSCIKPEDRDPNRLWKRENGEIKRGEVDLQKFEEFCRKHPQLVRRLREGLDRQTPRDVVEYLAAHQDLPTYYPRSDFERKFPVLPSRSLSTVPLDFAAEDRTLPDEFDNFAAARAWYLFAQQPLPPPHTWGQTTEEDRARYRVPRGRSLVLFRQDPARVQSLAAERLEAEGWFDDAGWEVDAGQQTRWFPHKVVIGDRRSWALDAWGKAADAWEQHGQRSGLLLQPDVLAEKENEARAYRTAYGVKPNELDQHLRPEDLPPEYRASFDAHRQLYWFTERRRLTFFGHFYAQSRALATPTGVAARKLIAQARKQHLAAHDARALTLYAEAFALWKTLLNDPKHADFRGDMATQEETYKMQAEYLRILHTEEVSESGRFHPVKSLLVLQDALAQAVSLPGATLWLPPVHLIPPREFGAPILGPFDGNASDGQPYISARAIEHAQGRPDFQDPQTAGK